MSLGDGNGDRLPTASVRMEVGRYSPASAAQRPNGSWRERRSDWLAGGIVKSMGFESEEQLVKAIVACTRRARRLDYRVELEVDAGVGIADLVLAKRAARTTHALQVLGSITPRLAVLLSPEVCSAITSKESLAASLGATAGGTARVISHLSSLGLVKRQAGSLFISPIITAPFQRVIAVEAKISEWQRVLVQAYRNLQFADESWVVLDHAYVRPALLQLDRFKEAGVGLASMQHGRGLYIHLAAKTDGPMSGAKRWQAQAILAARVIARRSASEGP